MLVLKFLDKLNMYLIKCCWCSVAKSCLTLCDPIDCSTAGFPVPHRLPEFVKFMLIELMMLSNYLSLCSPLFLLYSIFPSIRVFSSESAVHIRRAKGASHSSIVFPMSIQGLNLGLRHWRQIFLLSKLPGKHPGL